MKQPRSKQLPLSLYTATQCRELDRLAIEQQGIAGGVLMERAGSSVFNLISELYESASGVLVACGTGNNGGDGYVVARLLAAAGRSVQLVQVGPAEKISGDALTAKHMWLELGGQIESELPQRLPDHWIVVDALFGTGLERPLSGVWLEAVAVINGYANPVIAIDIPSGLHADSGRVMAGAIAASQTITFIALKRGIFTGEGPELIGELSFDDLGIPGELYAEVEPEAERLQLATLRDQLGRRRRTAHKGDYGHVLIIGGDCGMCGALLLAGQAALRVGAGLVSVATREAHAALYATCCPELMSWGVEEPTALNQLLERASVVAVGPGLGQSEWGEMIWQTLAIYEGRVVVDADGLNLLAKAPREAASWILTPHPGEAARLLDCPLEEIEADRFRAVTAIQQRYGGVVVLKGAGTLVAAGAGKLGVCSEGNPGMASGGMGDLLSGITAGLCAQGLTAVAAARGAVVLHANAADGAAADGERGLIASDLLPWIRRLVE